MHGGIEDSAPKQALYPRAAKHQIQSRLSASWQAAIIRSVAKAGNKQRVIVLHSICIYG